MAFGYLQLNYTKQAKSLMLEASSSPIAENDHDLLEFVKVVEEDDVRHKLRVQNKQKNDPAYSFNIDLHYYKSNQQNSSIYGGHYVFSTDLNET